MLKSIRNINSGWIIILTGLIIGVSGFSMIEGKAGEKTFLCFDEGCIYVQGISNISLGVMCIVFGIYMILKGKSKK